MARFDSYILCATPRCGSTLLCRMLSATGIAGHPESYFHRPSLAVWAEQHGLPPPAQEFDSDLFTRTMAATRLLGSAGTGIFGLRLMRGSFAYLARQLDRADPGQPDDATRFRNAFGATLFIHLTRTDKIAQAVSLTKAQQTGLWHIAPDGSEIERQSPPKRPRYDHAQIAANFDELTRLDTAWRRWFADQRIAPHAVSYETLRKDPNGTLADILDQLGLPRAAARTITPGVARLADATNRAWVRRFAHTERTPLKPL